MISYAAGILKHYLTLPVLLTAALLGLLCWQLCRRAAAQGRLLRRQSAALTALSVYLSLSFAMLLFARSQKVTRRFTLRLFWSYRAIAEGRLYLLHQDVFNVLLFIPFGLLCMMAERKPDFRKTLGLGAALSLLGELLQGLTARGLFELDDLFHNILGTAMGAGLWLLFSRRRAARAAREPVGPGAAEERRGNMKYKEKLINNYLTSFLWYGRKFLKYRIPMRLASLRPVEAKKAVFMSFNGRNYADNPRAVSEKLHETHPDWTIVWGMVNPEKARSLLPDYVRIVKFGSFAWYRELATASAWIVNVLLPNGVLKRKGQRYIQTWHGDRGMKKILFDATESMEKFRKRNYFRRIIEPELCDLGVVGSEYGVMQFRSAMHYEGELLRAGTPRDDCLLHLTEERRRLLREKLGLQEGKRVLLYAPTFRDHLHGAEQKTGELDLPAVLDALERRTGCPWQGVQRGHVGAHLERRESYDGRVTDLTDYPDMADVLCVTDLLITDYSSTPGDLALAGKGTILYQEDYAAYTADDRQLYFRMEDTPFRIARDQREMLELIDSWSEESAAANAREILEFYKTFETGEASLALVEYICQNEAAAKRGGEEKR
jgi:CDP-glycerol glycerophosphotransferase